MKKRTLACFAAAAVAVSMAGCAGLENIDFSEYSTDSSGSAAEDTSSHKRLSEMLGLRDDESSQADESTDESVPDESAVEQPESSVQEEGSEEDSADEESSTNKAEELLDLLLAGDQEEKSTDSTEPVKDIRDSSQTDAPSAGSVADDSAVQFELDSEAVRTPVYNAYAEIIESCAEACDKDPSLNEEFCRYYIADIDHNGVCELLAESGTCEADRSVVIYYFDELSGKAESAGSIVAWHSQLGFSGGNFCIETQAIGNYILTSVKLLNGTVLTERSDAPSSETALDVVISGFSYSDPSGLETM